MGADIPEEYDGPGSTFFDVILIVEGLAKVDPSVSVMVDVHNTLVYPLIMEYGTEEQKKKYLPHLCQDWVFIWLLFIKKFNYRLALSVYLRNPAVLMHLL